MYQIYRTRAQARKQLLSVFHEYGEIERVVYIYAIGAFFKAYEVTRDMVADDQVLPLDEPAQDEVRYLFAAPDQWNDEVGYERPDTDDSIHWRLNEELVGWWKRVVE